MSSDGRNRLMLRIRLAALLTAITFALCPILIQNASAAQNQTEELAVLLKAEKYKEALAVLQNLSDKGDVNSTYLLAMMYDNGRGTEQDFVKSFELFKKSAEKGHHPSENSLGQAYNSAKGTEKDLEAAVEWFRKSAEGGNATGQYNLGLRYAGGEGVEADPAIALEWFLKSAEQGNPFAQYNAAYAYATAAGTEKDLVEALKWAKLSSESGFKNAVVFTSFLASKTDEAQKKAALDKIGEYKMQQAGLVNRTPDQ